MRRHTPKLMAELARLPASDRLVWAQRLTDSVRAELAATEGID
ncbi:MAG: hypothetical protein RMN53_08535 [Anaerolineae bacterium]|nr:hypothetical protein [Anaerolineae bacterium]